LKETARVVGAAGDEERPVACRSGRDGHRGESLSQVQRCRKGLKYEKSFGRGANR
jgi:hypothetical protein